MRHVFGIFPKNSYEPGVAIPPSSRIVFDDWETPASAYFELIAPFFEEMSRSQCFTDLQNINVLVVFRSTELVQAIAVTEIMERDFSAFEPMWSHHQGSIKEPGKAERQVHMNLNRRRLLSMVFWLRAMFQQAINDEHCVVFGNGVCFRMLCGIKNPPGTEVYS
jgi:hypothetical protein